MRFGWETEERKDRGGWGTVNRLVIKGTFNA